MTAHPDHTLDTNDANDPPSPIPQALVDTLPLTGGLAALEAELLTESRPLRWQRPAAVAAAAAVVAGVALGAWSLTRPDSQSPGLATDPTPAATPTAPSGTPSLKGASIPTPTTVELPDWTPPTRLLSLQAPAGWESYQPGGSNDGWDLAWRRTGAEKYFTISYTNAADYTRYTLPGCCTPDEYTQVDQVDVLGTTGTRTLATANQSIHLPVADGYGITVNGSGTTTAEFDALLGSLTWTDRSGVDATQPGVIASTELATGVADALTRVEAPGGPLRVAAVGPHGRYMLDTAVLEAVTAAWVTEYRTAHSADDQARMDQVAEATLAVGRSHLARDAEQEVDPIQAMLARAMRHRFTPDEVEVLSNHRFGAASEETYGKLLDRLSSLR